ncbi:MAG: phosphatase PAP2 family protein [Salinigranum sp.]
MIRGIGPIQTLQHLVPRPLVPVFLFVTYLGSARIILPGLVFLYWRWDPRRVAIVGSVALGAFALTLTLKNAFALPRPPASLHLTYASGYGFPSGHALDSTATYGSLAAVLRSGTVLQRALLAGALVGLVALSRVVLGVHYPADVVAGIAVGLGYLLVVAYVLRWNVRDALVVATGLAAAGVVVAGGDRESLLLLAVVLAALLGWRQWGADRV